MRVLYVDDDRINTLLFEEMCRCAGDIEAVCAATGAEALEIAAAFAAEALVVDLHLPDTDGYALLPELRRVLGRDVPAFLCSAEDAEFVAAPARAAGYAGCWTKPVALETLLADLVRSGGAAA